MSFALILGRSLSWIFPFRGFRSIHVLIRRFGSHEGSEETYEDELGNEEEQVTIKNNVLIGKRNNGWELDKTGNGGG